MGTVIRRALFRLVAADIPHQLMKLSLPVPAVPVFVLAGL
jgi:hypothetical protein